MEKPLPSVTERNILSTSDKNVEKKVHISEAGNFLPKDASTLKDNSFAVKFDVTFAKSQIHPNLKGISSVDSMLIFQKYLGLMIKALLLESLLEKGPLYTLPLELMDYHGNQPFFLLISQCS